MAAMLAAPLLAIYPNTQHLNRHRAVPQSRAPNPAILAKFFPDVVHPHTAVLTTTALPLLHESFPKQFAKPLKTLVALRVFANNPVVPQQHFVLENAHHVA